jgi:hypothetical protein
LTGSIIAFFVCFPLALVAATRIIVLLKNRKSQAAATSNIFGGLENIPGRPREFRYKDLKKATNNFSAKAELGRGGFRIVYRGILPKEKTVVAVKRIAKDSNEVKRNLYQRSALSTAFAIET